MLDAERLARVERLYQRVLDSPPERRSAVLEESCSDDPDLLHELESLLKAREEAGNFLSPDQLSNHIRKLDSAPATPAVGRTLGPYRIVAEIGSGAMGDVYRARDSRLDRELALKILPSVFTHDAERIARFRLEAKAASALNHPNIVTIYEIGQIDETWFIAEELIEGVTLRERLSGGKLPLQEATEIGFQCAMALEAAHRAGIVHRDIKPENIMMRSDVLVKIVDFGLARIGEAGQTSPQATQAGSIMGTPRYMSPEQARGEKLNARSDIFSLGAVLFEMVCGYAAFPGASTAEVFAALLGAPPNQRDTGPLRHVLSRALQNDATARYASMAEFAAAIRRGDPHREKPPQLWRSGAETRVGLLPLRVKWAVLALAIAGLAIFAWSWRIRTAPNPAALDVVPMTTFEGAKDYPALAPDGSRVAFSWQPSPRDTQHIYVKPVKSGEPRQLTFGPQEDVLPSWSPDGSFIAFCRRTPGQTGYDSRAPVISGIYIMPVKGGAERRVGSWSADGRKLVTGEVNGASDSGGLDLLDIDSGHRTRLTMQGIDSLPVFSPDGKWVAFKREFSGSAQELFLIPASGGRPRQITSDARPIDGITWTADSREIVFTSTRRPIERQSLASFCFRRPASCHLCISIQRLLPKYCAPAGQNSCFQRGLDRFQHSPLDGQRNPSSRSVMELWRVVRHHQFHARRSQSGNFSRRRTDRLRLGSHRQRGDLGFSRRWQQPHPINFVWEGFGRFASLVSGWSPPRLRRVDLWRSQRVCHGFSWRCSPPPLLRALRELDACLVA
jgi:hypothetical protein